MPGIISEVQRCQEAKLPGIFVLADYADIAACGTNRSVGVVAALARCDSIALRAAPSRTNRFVNIKWIYLAGICSNFAIPAGS